MTTSSKFGRMLSVAQSVLKIGSALAERVGHGEVGGYTALVDSAWRLLRAAGPGQRWNW